MFLKLLGSKLGKNSQKLLRLKSKLFIVFALLILIFVKNHIKSTLLKSDEILALLLHSK